MEAVSERFSPACRFIGNIPQTAASEMIQRLLPARFVADHTRPKPILHKRIFALARIAVLRFSNKAAASPSIAFVIDRGSFSSRSALFLDGCSCAVSPVWMAFCASLPR